MTSAAARIGVACLNPSERAAVADWLRTADLEPVILAEACVVSADIGGQALECVVADAALLRREYLSELRRVDARLPVIAIGDASDPRRDALERRDVQFLERPMDQQALLLAVSLAAAEGRPARRSLRKLVPRLPSTIDGAVAVLLDVSGEGLRVEVPAGQGARLAPMFHVQVPMYRVGVTVRRVWVAAGTPGSGRVQCGASMIETDERTIKQWKALIDHVGSSVPGPRARPQAVKVEKERFLGKLAQVLSDAPLVSQALSWRPGRSS